MKLLITIALVLLWTSSFPIKAFAKSNDQELKKLSSEIISLLEEYGGGEQSQEGKFQGCTFYLQYGEENYKIWKYAIPLGALHYQSLRNYRATFDRDNIPIIRLKTAKGQAIIDSTFLQWTFGVPEQPLKTLEASATVSFSDEDIARAAAAAFARVVEICAGK